MIQLTMSCEVAHYEGGQCIKEYAETANFIAYEKKCSTISSIVHDTESQLKTQETYIIFHVSWIVFK